MNSVSVFCFVCCCLVISAYSAECSKQLEGVNEPPTPTDLEVFEPRTIQVSRLDFVADVRSACTDLHGWAHQKRKISTYLAVDSQKSKKSWFVNAYGFVGGLMLLICFAVCVVLSGVTYLMLMLIQIHFSLIALFLLPPWMLTVVLLIGLVFPDHTMVPSLLTSYISVRHNHSLQAGRLQMAPKDKCRQITIISPMNQIVVYISSGRIQAMLLQRSGDVELNPGPGRDTTNTTDSQQQDIKLEEPAAIAKETSQLNEGHSRVGTNEEVKQTELQQIQERFPDLPGYFDSDDDGIQITVDKDIQSPLTQEDGHTLLKHTTPLPSVGDGSVHPTSNDCSNSMFLPSYPPPTVTEYPTRSRSYVALNLTTSRAKDEQQLVMEAYDDWNKKSSQDKRVCCITFDEVMIKLFLNLIRFYRDRDRDRIKDRDRDRDEKIINFCPQCFEVKDKRSIRLSHIIPKSMLETFRLIHVPVQQFENQQEDIRILINFSKWSKFPPDKATASLLCNQCEVNSSINEGDLKGVYLSVISNPDALTCQIKGMKYRDLHHILAQILFRGLLVNIDIDGYNGSWFMDEEFCAKFTLLWNYSRNVNFQNPPDIRLFLLPNKAYDAETTFSLFSMERILRSPHYTELVSDKAGLYLYLKIDCFHIVLPIDKKSERYLHTFRNGLYTDEATEETFLLQCTRPKRRQSYEQPFSADELTTHFPDVLTQWNVELHNNYIHMMLNQPSSHKIRDYDIPFIIFPREEHKYNDSDLSIRKEKVDELAWKAKSTIDLTHAKKFDLKKLDCKKATEYAASISPLRVVMVSKAEHEQLIALKTKLREKEAELLESNEQRDVLLSRIDDTLAQNEILRELQIKLHRELTIRRCSETRERDLRIEQTKISIKSYKERYNVLFRKYSAAPIRCTGGSGREDLRKEINTDIEGIERLKKSASDLGDVYYDCTALKEQFCNLLCSRTLSN